MMPGNQLIVDDDRRFSDCSSQLTADQDSNASVVTEQKKSSIRLPTDSFDWKHGWFKEEGLPLWLNLLLQFLFSLLMITTPPIISQMKLVKGAYPLLCSTPPIQPNAIMETLRVVWLLGGATMIYFFIQLFLCIVPYVTFKLAEWRCVPVEDAVRQSIEQTWSIREYFGLAGAGIALAVFSKILYPELEISTDLVSAVVSKVVSEEKDEKDKGKIHIPDIITVSKNLENYFQNSTQFFVKRGCLAFAVVAFLVLFEKLILKAVTHRYQSHSLEDRIASNKFARKIIQALKKYIISNTKLKKSEKKCKNRDLIFNFIGKSTVTADDFAVYMNADVAKRFFSILDPDNLTELNRCQFCCAVDAVYHERASIDKAFLEQSNILGKFDNLLMVIVWIVSFLVLFMVMEPPIKFLITLCITLIGGLMFMFQATAKQAFESIVFVIFTHPFDCDDWVIIKDKHYQVHEVGLWTSIFVSSDGKLCYMSNKSLVSLPITNLRRSPLMSEKILVSLKPNTPQERIQTLEAKLIQWLKDNDREFVPSLMIRDIKLVDKDHMRIEIPLSHKSNFNDMDRKEMRTRKFMFYLKEAIGELEIELSPPLRA